MRQYAVEDAAAARILVETGIDKITDAAAALRATPAVCLFDADRGFTKRVGLTHRVLTVVFQEGDEVAYCHMSEPENEGIPRLVNELIDPAGLEAGGKIDMRIRRHHGSLGALMIQPAPSLEAGKLPVRAWHGDARIARIAPTAQAGLGGIARHGRMTAGRDAAAQRIDRDPWLLGDELHAHGPSDRPAVVGGYRKIEYLPSVARKQVTLPGEPNHRIAAPHEEAVASMCQ